MLHEPEHCAAVEKAAAREGQAEGAPHREGWHREPSPRGVLRCVLLEGVECGDAAPLRLMYTHGINQTPVCCVRSAPGEAWRRRHERAWGELIA